MVKCGALVSKKVEHTVGAMLWIRRVSCVDKGVLWSQILVTRIDT